MRPRLFCLLFALFLGSVGIQASDQSPKWIQNPFYFTANEDPLSEVLTSFCQEQGVSAVISPKITGTVRGKFTFQNKPAEFLRLVCQINGLSWYFDGSAAYFYKIEETQNAVLQLGHLSPKNLQSALIKTGVFDSRFPWQELPDERMVYFSGPPRYVQQVKNLATTLEKNAANNMVMKIFRLNHAWADDIELDFMEKNITVPGVATLLRNLHEKGQIPKESTGIQSGTEQVQISTAPGSEARIQADPRLNAVIVWDIAEQMPKYEQAVRELDPPVDLVEIRAAIVDVSTNRLHELGISWNFNKGVAPGNQPREKDSYLGGSNVTANNFFNPQGKGLNFSTIYTHGIDNLMARVNALAQDGDASIFSRPTVLTLDNIQALLQKTSTFYVRLQGEREVDLKEITYGTVLKVTPHIITASDGKKQIKLVVTIEDGSENEGAKGADNIPVVSRSTINTQAIVEESQTLIIGGHYFERQQDHDSGIPGLKNLPLLGPLFGQKSHNIQKAERLFVISPQIVDLKQVASQQRIKRQAFEKTLVSADAELAPLSRTTGPFFGGCTKRAPGPESGQIKPQSKESGPKQ